jgi:hypothetical protein
MATAYEVNALELELKTYAHDLIATHVVGEYEDRINAWKQHINVLVDAQKDATDEFKGLLEDEQRRLAQDNAVADFFGLATLALSFVAGPLLSWVAGKITYKWFPAYTAKLKERSVVVRNLTVENNLTGKRIGGARGVITTVEMDHDKVMAKVYGDLGKEVVGLGIKGALKVATPDFAKAKSAVTLAESSTNITSFRTNLENSLLEQSRVTTKAMRSLAMSILEDPDYGHDCLEKLSGQYQGYVNPSGSNVGTLRSLAKGMIRADIDKIRQQWADDWFFYGRNPPKLTAGAMRDGIELELWALWILNEQFKLNFSDLSARFGMDPNHEHDASLDREKYNPVGIVAVGKTFPRLTEPILARLAKFGVVEARTFAQKMDRTIRERQKEIRRDAEPPARTMGELNQRWVDRKLEDIAERKERPEIQVGAKVDSEAEIRDLENWAKHHPPRLSAGRLLYTKRDLLPIEKLYQ